MPTLQRGCRGYHAMKDPPEHAVPELGDCERQIFQGEAEGKQSRVLNLQPVVENRDPGRSSPLRVVGVNDSVDDHLSDRLRGQAPSIPAPEPADDGPAYRVLLDEGHRFFDGLNRMHFEPDVVEDGRLVRLAARRPDGWLTPRVRRCRSPARFV